MSKKNPNWNKEEDAILKKYYGVISYKEMLQYIPYRTISSIKNRIRLLKDCINIVPRGISKFSHLRKNVNDDFFSEINEKSSYWAGFIAADGCIKKGNILKIKLSIRDSSHLDKFIDAIGYDGKKTYQEGLKKDGTFRGSVEISIRSPKICLDLWNNFKIGPRKTFTISAPPLIGNLLDCWIIGYLDGDGTIGYYGEKRKQKYLNIIVVGRKAICKCIRKRFSEILKDKIKNKITIEEKIFRLSISGSRAEVIYAKLRDYDVPKMDRKWKYYPKSWGYELWIANSEKYCGKVLYFNKGKRCSFHYHKSKVETFFLQQGKLLIRYSFKDNLDAAETMILKAGGIMDIPVGLIHQMIALENSTLIEFSTQHFDEDSYRIIKGD